MLGTKMLVIDDDANICELIKIYFQNEGYDVVIANDGIEGMATFKSYDPDIVLLDLSNLNGLFLPIFDNSGSLGCKGYE